MKILKIEETIPLKCPIGNKIAFGILSDNIINIDNFNEDKKQPKQYTHIAAVEICGGIGILYGDENLENTLKKLKLGWKWVE